jgi:hypothetical protein
MVTEIACQRRVGTFSLWRKTPSTGIIGVARTREIGVTALTAFVRLDSRHRPLLSG